MESVFALLQKKVRDRRHWRTRQELRMGIVTWAERTYHHRRGQEALGRLPPMEYETSVSALAAQAAWPNLSPVRATAPGGVGRLCKLPS